LLFSSSLVLSAAPSQTPSLLPSVFTYLEYVRVDVGVELAVQGLLDLFHGLLVAGGGGGEGGLEEGGRWGGRGGWVRRRSEIGRYRDSQTHKEQ